MLEIIQELNKVKSKEDLIKHLTNFFYNNIENSYAPALIKIGDALREESLGDLYLKLILAPKDTDINSTWMKGNLQKTMPIFEDDERIYNLITLKNYKYNSIYDINPVLYSDENMVEIEQTNTKYNNIMVNSYKRNKEMSALKLIEDDGIEMLFIHYDILELHTDVGQEHHYMDQMDLYLEFEYRSKEKLYLENFNGRFNNSFLDIVVQDEINRMSDISTWVRGTLPLDLQDKFISEKLSPELLSIKVNSLDGGIRDLNPNNYNDDMEAGLIVFDNEALDILINEYYFFDMILVSKNENRESVLIDLFENYFVFWEGEFNKLPYDIKEALVEFNIEKEEGIISESMFAWQLGNSWDYIEKASPFIKLVSKIRADYYDMAIDYGMSFYYPRNNEEFSKILQYIEVIYSISPTSFNSKFEDVRKIQSIYTNGELKFSRSELKLLIEKYSFAVLDMIDND